MLGSQIYRRRLRVLVVQLMRERGMEGEPIPIDQQFQYDAILMIDGNVVPDRFAYQLAGGTSAIIKVDSTKVEYWYPNLVPWEHYIPVKADLSDLEDVLDRVINNSSLLASKLFFIYKTLNLSSEMLCNLD